MTRPDPDAEPAWAFGVAPGQPPLARTTLNRAAHRRTDEAWLAEAYKRGLVLVVDIAAGGRALIGEADNGLVLLDADQAPAVPPAERMFLGLVDGDTPVFAVVGEVAERSGLRPADLRQAGHLLSDRDLGLLTTAAALGHWHARHPFSSQTGLPTTPTDGGWVRQDPEAGTTWPRTDPAMIVLVHDGVPGPEGRCLLGNNATWPAGWRRRYSCLAGFVEPGESAEAAVAREVEEEVGIPVRAITYAGSQAWPFPGSLMLGFFALADPDTPLRLDPAEIADARWFTRREMSEVLAGTPEAPFTLSMSASIAYYLITRWHAGAR
ncbi:NAD(+) diphosphatase [Rhizomonospora bruguierae]|uniref:NAD(+) diphosphatase n=1 Tax=Rhizomonospora bruguierae TaxID=1581705 RepID=UPI0020C06662|nr:NAD(+) diphosphatase [Micromonospora sp. NBRC 107566]